jgi:hypothetical protein
MKRAARGLDYPAQGIRVDRRLAKHPQIAQKKQYSKYVYYEFLIN